MSVQAIIYAKQNGAQLATVVATGTRADNDVLRKTMAALGTRLFQLIHDRTNFNGARVYLCLTLAER